jgi:hypothetical protein
VNTLTIIAFCEAIVCYFSTSLGFVLQKKGISWLDNHGEKDRRYYSNLCLWLIGYALLNLAIIPNYLALGVLNSYIVNAISGLNIVFVVFLSKLVLKESIYRLDYFYTFIMCTSIVLINLVDRNVGAAMTIQVNYAYLAAAIPIIIFLIWGIARVTKIIQPTSGLQAIFLAALGGGMSGSMVTYLKILEIERGMHILSYLTSPFLYCFLAVALLSMVAFQLAYKMGAMILVGPAQFATMVFYPVMISYPIFQIPVNPIQMICFLVIILSVGLMVYNHNVLKK